MLLFEDLFQAVKNNNIQEVQKFIDDKEFNIADKDNQIFIIACFNGNIDIIKMLLADERINPNARNNNAVLVACNANNVEVLEVILADPRIDVTANEQGALKYVCGRFDFDYNVLNKLINHPLINLNLNNNESFFKACQSGNLKAVKLFLNNPNFNLDEKDKFKAVKLVCCENNSDTLEYFIQNKDFNSIFNDYNIVRHTIFESEGCFNLLFQYDKINMDLVNYSDISLCCNDYHIEQFEQFYNHKDFSFSLYGESLFKEACIENHPLIINLFLKDNKINPLNYPEIFNCFLSPNLDCIMILLNNKNLDFIKESPDHFKTLCDYKFEEDRYAIIRPLFNYNQLNGNLINFFLLAENKNLEIVDLLKKLKAKNKVTNF